MLRAEIVTTFGSEMVTISAFYNISPPDFGILLLLKETHANCLLDVEPFSDFLNSYSMTALFCVSLRQHATKVFRTL